METTNAGVMNAAKDTTNQTYYSTYIEAGYTLTIKGEQR